MILILTNSGDSHADAVISELRRRHAPVARFDVNRVLHDVTVSVGCGDKRIACLQVDGQQIDLTHARSIWYRRPLLTLTNDTPHEDESFQCHAMVLDVLWSSLKDAFWVNRYDNDQTARCKPYQLEVARAVGFEIPRTLITTDPDAASAFVESCLSGAIYKTFVSHRRLGPAGRLKVSYAQRVTSADICRLRASVRRAPCLFQEYVQKRSEIRAIVIGQRVFADEIQPDGVNDQVVDWRSNIRCRKHQQLRLDDRTVSRILALMRRLGLVTGCIDLLRTDTGRIVFLEINPHGQWHWVEEMTGMPLVKAFAETLVRADSG